MLNNQKNWLGILTLVFVFGIITVGCGSTPSASQGILSGTYTYGSNASISFIGNNYTIRVDDNIYTGNYSVSGNTFTLFGHDSITSWIIGTWVIIDSNSISDSDGDIWRKQQTSSQAVGRYEEVTFENQTGVPIYYMNMSLTTDDSWGDDWLGDNFIIHGGTYTVRLLPGEYDVRVLDRNGDTIREFWITVRSDNRHLFSITLDD